jgi:DNA-binding response OmpR family regulator
MAAMNLAARNVVLALPESPVTRETAERLRASGWRVHRVADGEALRRLACRMTPEVVVLPADGTDESGWLTCAKLLTAIPRPRVIVVGELTADAAELARFIGAEAPVPANTCATELVDRIEAAQLQSA